jgi:hypothetical protein
MWRIIFIVLFGFILMISFAQTTEEGFSLRFTVSAIVSAMLVGYLLVTGKDDS